MEMTNSRFRRIAAMVVAVLFILFVPLLSENHSNLEDETENDTITVMEDSVDAGVFY